MNAQTSGPSFLLQPPAQLKYLSEMLASPPEKTRMGGRTAGERVGEGEMQNSEEEI